MRKILTLLMGVLLVGSVWGADGDVAYTLSFSKLTSGTNYQSYGAAHDITVSSKSWSVFGNQNLGNWLGVGGTSLTGEGRTITGKSSIDNIIKQVKVNYSQIKDGNSSSLTVDSAQLEVGNIDFSSITETVKVKGLGLTSSSSAGYISFTPASINWASGKYYRITIFCTTTGSKNSRMDVTSIQFIEGSLSADPSVIIRKGEASIETLNLPVTGVAAPGSTLNLAYFNIKADSEGTPTISYYSNAACTESAATPAWFSPTVTDKNTITYTATLNNTGATRTVYAVVSNTVKNTSNADATVTDTLTISQNPQILVTSVSVKASTTIEVGSTETLSATILPDNASDKTVTWASDDTDVADVDEDGVVTAKAKGTANITATANDGSGKSATCVVTVISAVPYFIIDGSTLTSTLTEAESTQQYTSVNNNGNKISLKISEGAKAQAVQNTAVNAFDKVNYSKAILIGPADAYIYNSTAIPGIIESFEIYANKGASTSAAVSVTFSQYPLTEAGTSASDTIYEATLNPNDKIYDCSAKIPDGARYFYYEVTSSANTQVQFRIKYTPLFAVTFEAPSDGTLVVKNGGTPIKSGDEFFEETTLTVEATPTTTGYKLITLTANGNDIKEDKEFTIGTTNVVVAATFEDATAVDNTADEVKAVKTIVNGQLFIEKNGHVYNILGTLVK